MSEPVLHYSTDQTLSSSAIDSSSSSREKKEIINRLQNKVTDLLVHRNSNEKLVKSQDNLKRCLERLEKYKKLNQELQQKQNIICDALGISYNSDLKTIRKSNQEIRFKFMLLNSIQNELNIQQNLNLDQSNVILDEIQKMKNKYSENNRFIFRILRVLGIFTNHPNFDINQNKELPTSNILDEIQKFKEETEKLKATVENFTDQQNEICHMLDIDNLNENDIYTLHFRIKGAIKNMKNNLQDEINDYSPVLTSKCQKKANTPQIVKTAITDLQISTNKIKKDLYESEQKLKQTANRLQNIEKKNECIFKKFGCNSIDDVSENFEEVMKMMNASNLNILRSSIRQMKDQNKSLHNQSNELYSQAQILQSNNQKLNNQLITIQDELNNVRSKLNESEAKKSAYKDDLKELKSKLHSIKMELKSTSLERNNLRGQLTDKDEEIISLKELLQTEKGNVKIKFDEMETQILSSKQQIRKSQQETELIRSDFENLQQSNNSLQQQYKLLKEEKQNLESELENNKSKIRNLNNEIESNSNELETVKNKNENMKQQNQSLQKEIDDSLNEQSNLKRKINNLNNQIDSLQNEKSKILSQLENELKENHSMKQAIEENRSKISQLETLNSQQNSEIQNLNQIKQDLSNKNNEFQKQVSQFQLKTTEYEQTIQMMQLKTDQLQNNFNSMKMEKETLQSQVNSHKLEIESLRNENTELKKNIFQLQKENQTIKFDCEQKNNKFEMEIRKLDQMNKNLQSQIDEINKNENENENQLKTKISQLLKENSDLKLQNEETNQKINEIVQNQCSYCKLLGINPNSTDKSIADSISDLLYDNKEMYTDNQNMKQQLSSISSLLNIGDSNNYGSIHNAINSLYDEIQHYERQVEKMNINLKMMKQSNQKMCKILNVMNSESLIDAISSVQAIISHIKQILNVSDDKIVDCIDSLHESIQTLCDALNIDPKDSWIDSILSMYEALQDAAELLGITNSNQLSESIQKVLSERESYSIQLNQIFEVIQKWKNNSFNNTNTIVDSLCDDIQASHMNQLVSDVVDLIHQIDILKSNEEEILTLFGLNSSQFKSSPIDKIKEIVENYKKEINKLKENIKSLQKQNDDIQSNFDHANISLKEVQLQKSSLTQQVEELQKQNDSFYQQSENCQQKNADLTKKLDEINIQNSDLSSRIELLQNEVDNLSQLNEDLKQQNSTFEAESQSSLLLERQLSDICRLLQINRSNDQDISNSIAKAIESLKKAKEEFINFKWKVKRILNSRKNDQNSSNISNEEEESNESTAEILREIEALSQLVLSLCRLFNVKSSDLLLDAAKKQDALIRQISPLFESIDSNNNDLLFDEEIKKWQRIRQTSDKITALLNAKDGSTAIEEIKNIQNQLAAMQSKNEENAQFIDQLCETLEINKDENSNKNYLIQTAIKELKENSNDSQKVFSQISKLFNCESDYVVNFAEIIIKTVKNIAKILEINAENSGLFSEIENEVKEIKDQNELLKKRIDDDKLFAFTLLNEVNLANELTDDIVRETLLKLKNINAEQKHQIDELKSNKEEKDFEIVELEDKVALFKRNIRKIFEKFDMISQLDNGNESDKSSNSSYDSKFKEIYEKIDEFQQIKKDYQKSLKKNKELSTRIRSIELENIRHVNQIKQTTNQISNVDDAIKYMKNHEIQINKLREIVGIPDSQFTIVVDKVSKIVDQLNSEIRYKEKLNQELQFSNERINDFKKNEIQYKKLINTQENKIDSLTIEAEKRDIIINNLNSSLNKIFKSIGDESIRSVDFAIDFIEEQKRKIAELNKELSALKSAATVDSAFDKISANEKKQLKFIKKKIIEQTDYFNSVIAKLQIQLENKNQNKEEMIRILKDAESDNFRLLDLLDPPLKNPKNTNLYSHIHIGNEYAMNPFAKQNADIFRKRRINLESGDKAPSNNELLNHKIATSENALINQKKLIDITKKKGWMLDGEQRQKTSNTRLSITASDLIAQRKTREQTTLF